MPATPFCQEAAPLLQHREFFANKFEMRSLADFTDLRLFESDEFGFIGSGMKVRMTLRAKDAKELLANGAMKGKRKTLHQPRLIMSPK